MKAKLKYGLILAGALAILAGDIAVAAADGSGNGLVDGANSSTA